MAHDVYWCISRGGWSIRDPKTGLVVDHAAEVYVHGARFVVQEGGRQRVLRERRKNVHAYVRGDVRTVPPNPHRIARIRYNPYEHSTFIYADTGQPVTTSPALFFSPDGTLYEVKED